MNETTQCHQTSEFVPPRRERSARTPMGRRLVLVAGALVIAGAGIAVAGFGGSTADDPIRRSAQAESGLAAVSSDVASGAPAVPDASDGTAQSAAPAAPAAPPAPAEPGLLAVNTGMIHLPDGTFSGQFVVRNDGGSDLEWHWAPGSPHISVSRDGGVLASGDSTVVTFVIDHTKFAAGEFQITNCVFADDDQAKDVAITGKKLVTVNPGVVLPNPQIKP